MSIYLKVTTAFLIFWLFFTALNIKLRNFKLKQEIVLLEEKSKDLNIKLANKMRRFEWLTNHQNIKRLALKHKVVLKDMESIKMFKNSRETNPLARDARKKP